MPFCAVRAAGRALTLVVCAQRAICVRGFARGVRGMGMCPRTRSGPRSQRLPRLYLTQDVYWIGYLLSSEQTHTQVQLLFARALEDQGLLGSDGLPPERDEEGPILVAWSDNGAEMTAIDTRQFIALMAIAQHHGRPGTPDRPGARRIVLQPPEGRLATPGRDPRPDRARHRARPHPHPVQHRPAAMRREAPCCIPGAAGRDSKEVPGSNGLPGSER